ncbi:sulfite exporter TauE/SafE family protein [Paenibacillus puerhi]|uniref:sulfite exporter TauE/SafE family protein n=1 Tax=Paenibacillus puerhi TaxID=2692622 RepID=UPI00135843B7|nr:sulfite exporter TauE/SafE family protein [Paenibacillus puerhi]
MELELMAIGAFIGILIGLTGVGGASLLTPLLVAAGVQPLAAVATDLVYNSATKLFGSIQHLRQRTVNLALARQFALGSLPGAAASILLLKWYPPLHTYQDLIIRHALGYMLVIVALLNLIQFMIKEGRTSALKELPLQRKLPLTITIGFVLGFLVGFTSIGSGSLFALAMMWFYRLSSAELVGTDVAHAFLLVTAAGLLHIGFGHVQYGLVFQLLIGSIPGVLLGSKWSSRMPAKPLRLAITVLILISGIKLIIS